MTKDLFATVYLPVKSHFNGILLAGWYLFRPLVKYDKQANNFVSSQQKCMLWVLDEMVLLSTQNISLKLWVKKYLQFYAEIFIYLIKKEGKDQESIKSSTTPDSGYQWESDNVTIRHHKGEQRGQPFHSRWPQGINKQMCMKA